MKCPSFPPMAIAYLILILTICLNYTAAQIGVAYGREGNGLPSPAQVVDLFKQYNIRRMRIYDTYPETLAALRGSDIDLTVGILNPQLGPLAADPAAAATWVSENILPYHPDVKFRHVVVGNEAQNTEYADHVLPAMRNIHNALSIVPGLAEAVKVTTAVGTEVVDPHSNFPPESGRFRAELASYMDQIVRFLFDNNAPLFVSVYPYFAYVADQMSQKVIDIRYARLDPDFPGITTEFGHTYKNLFYALLDVVNAAVDKSLQMTVADAENMKPRPTVVAGESGNPTLPGSFSPMGLAAEAVEGGNLGTIDNARLYINNLVQAVKSGTPLRPDQPIETYIFAMFDEEQKKGDEAERHFGLFMANGQPKYPVKFD